MKKETFIKRLTPLFTKQGVILKKYESPISELLNGNYKFYYNSWVKNGKHFNLKDNLNIYLTIFNSLQLKYTIENDSIRGGKAGNFIKLTPKSIRAIHNVIYDYKVFIENEKLLNKHFYSGDISKFLYKH